MSQRQGKSAPSAKSAKPAKVPRPARRSAHKEGGKKGGGRGAHDAARQAALTLVDGVLRHGRSMDDLWEALVDDAGALARAEPRDRAFCRRLSATTLRHVGSIDKILLQRMRSLPRGQAAAILRLGVAELVYLGTPGHAAVSCMVELVGHKGPKGLINAVLRRVAEAVEQKAIAPGPAHDDVPDWLLRRWQHTYGSNVAQAMAAASLQEAPMDITAPQETQKWAEALGGKILPTGSIRLADSGNVPDMPGYEAGTWWVQDAAAAVPVRLLTGLTDLTGRSVADICAAPGGKTAQLAAAGAVVTAVDVSAARLQRLQQNMTRLGQAVTVAQQDVLTWRPAQNFDVALLDAPCSATGTLRRHPDLMHLKTGQDVEALSALQTRMLDQVASVVKPGGLLLYCTCSLEPEEGEQQAAAFLSRHTAYARVPIGAAELGGIADAITGDGDVRLRPDMWCDLGGIDGFYIARFRHVGPD